MTSAPFAAGAYAAAQSVGKMPIAHKPVAAAGGAGFVGLLGQALDTAARTGSQADSQAASVAAGKANVVDVVTAVAESETALQTLVAVRDRVISAYEEIMRMPI